MKTNYIIAIIGLALLTYTIHNSEQSIDQYEQWKLKNHKLYLGAEDQYRREIFHQNLKIVNEHNQRYEQGLETYSLDTNLFADLSFEEFSSLYLYSTYRDQDAKQNKKINSTNKQTKRVSAPSKFDWTEYFNAAYPKVYSQGRCLASWAFAVAGSIEIAQYNDLGAYIQRSPQYLINCVGQANPCLGGSVSDTWTWAKNNAVYSEKDVPYVGQQQACAIPVPIPGPADDFQIAGSVTKEAPFDTHEDYYSHLSNGVKGLAILVSPISISNIHFQLYKDGIFDGACGNTLNYDAMVVGYDDTGVDATSYYKLRMSWSQGYGEQGYIRIQMATECLYSKLSYAI